MQVYTPHDIALREQAVLRLTLVGEDINGESPTHDIKFQFPPKILSDNRKGSWKEGDLRGTEPVSEFETSGPREITLSWTYIVDGSGFTTADVAKEVHAIRGYFAAVRDIKATSRNLIVDFRYILYGDNNEMSARIKAIDVKHGDTIICPSRQDYVLQNPLIRLDPSQSFPLRTDITVDLRLWTQGGETVTQDLDGLRKKLSPAWY